MNSAIDSIFTRLKDFAPVCFIRCPDRTGIAQFEVWDACENGMFREDTLYYVQEEVLNASCSEVLPRNILCCSRSASCPEKANMIRLSRSVSPEELAPIIKTTLDQIRKYDGIMQEMLQLTDHENCIADLLDCYGSGMRVAVIVRDTSFKRIAASSRSAGHIPYSEKIEKVVNEEFLTEHSLSVIEDLHRLQNILADAPYTITNYAMMPDELRMPEQAVSGIDLPIKSRGNTVAFMSVISYERIMDTVDVSIAQDVARFLAMALVRDELVQNQTYRNFSALLHDVITSSVTDEKIIRLRLHSLKWKLHEELYVAVLVPRQDRRARRTLAGLREVQSEFHTIVPECISDIYQDKAYFLISRKRGEDAVPLNQKRLTLFLKATGNDLGISTVFHDPSQIYNHYQQAEQAVTIGQKACPEKMIYSYDLCTITSAVMMLSGIPNLDAEDYCHPVIRDLHASKKESDHELLLTLEKYLFSMKDVTKTYEALHIHRSTLFYRLNKLKDLLGEDAFNDGECVQRLMFSFSILHYLEDFP